MYIVDTVKILYAVKSSVREVPDGVEELGIEDASFLHIWSPLLLYFLMALFLVRFSVAKVENNVLQSTNDCSSKNHILDGIQSTAAIFQVFKINAFKF